MTIDGAIEHAREVAKRRMTEYENHYDKDAYYYPRQCKKCAEEHIQLAEWLEELKQYRAIGTLEECRAAVEKQTKKNLIFDKPLMVLSCPICGHYAQEVVDDGSTRGNIPKYCSRCGQKLDWSDEE